MIRQLNVGHDTRASMRERSVTQMAGFYYPRTATGQSSLLPGPALVLLRRPADRRVPDRPGPGRRAVAGAAVARAEDPGAVALIWADWQSCGASGEELLDPVRSQYRECFAVVRCAYAGVVYSRCVFIWVDTDFALARGLVQGYPKKLGRIHQSRPHPFGRAAPRIASGGVFAGTLSAGGRRLAEAVVTLASECESNGFVNAHPMAHHRWMPSIVKDGGDSLSELVRSGSASVEAGPPGAATRGSTCSPRPPRNWPSWRSTRSSAATTARSGSPGTAAPCWPIWPSQISASSPACNPSTGPARL